MLNLFLSLTSILWERYLFNYYFKEIGILPNTQPETLIQIKYFTYKNINNKKLMSFTTLKPSVIYDPFISNGHHLLSQPQDL